MNILLVCPMQDKQSGIYLHNSLIELGHKVAYFDWRMILEKHGVGFMNMEIKNAVTQLKPDLILIIKGLGLTADTINELRSIHKCPIVGWIFDVTLGGTYVKDVAPYVDFLKSLDMFYTIDRDAVTELCDLGVKAKWLSEGCHAVEHREEVINSIQVKKYGADVIFLGSVGSIHPGRDKLLERIWKEGFNLRLYGDVLYPEGKEPQWVKDCHCGFMAINNMHSIVCQSGKIILGIDGWPHRKGSWSARLYRTLCPGGFYLTSHTEGIEEYFKLGEHLDTFKTEDEMIEKISYWLSNDEKREAVAKAGQKLILEKHQFTHRLNEIVEDAKKL